MPGLAVAALLLVGATPAGARSLRASAAPSYSTTPGPYQKLSRFRVTYAGSGSWGTMYHSEPPNPGGNPDDNRAADSSTQKWGLTYSKTLAVPACARATGRRANPCRQIQSLSGATGHTSATGRVRHVHVDGLYPADNRSESCQESVSTSSSGETLNAILQLRYEARAKALAITALNPVANALEILPGQCPDQGDPIDGLYDNYYTPGFSFASAYGPDRWFTSATVFIPLAKLHHSQRVSISFADTPAGTPPPDCAVQHPSYEQCATGGSWSGTLVLTRRPAPTSG